MENEKSTGNKYTVKDAAIIGIFCAVMFVVFMVYSILTGASLFYSMIFNAAPLRSVLGMCHRHIAPYPIFAYRGIIIPLLCSYRGGSQGLSPTYEQAHVGLDLLTLVSSEYVI